MIGLIFGAEDFGKEMGLPLRRDGEARDLIYARSAFVCAAARLGHADAVLLGGGIGEHMPAIRAEILGGLDELGLRLDSSLNQRQREGDGRISSEDSRIDAWALATDEESVIARDAIALLNR